MDLAKQLKSWKNGWDLSLRNGLRFGYSVKAPLSVDLQFQNEMREFLTLFNWNRRLGESGVTKPFTLLDVGARNFSLAPVLDGFFRAFGFEPELHGIEIDAFRRLSNLHTRCDYGVYYAGLARRATYHPTDFLNWQHPANVVFLLNPFVTASPLLAWGLPLKHFQPKRIFEHAHALLAPTNGLLLVSSPTEEEAKLVPDYTKGLFQLVEDHTWVPGSGGNLAPNAQYVQKDPRFGRLYRVQGE